MSWTDFHCDEPDFVVRSVSDNQEFAVSRKALQQSEVFRDMFYCCDAEDAPVMITKSTDEVLELRETAATLTALLRLLHFPPSPPAASEAVADPVTDRYRGYDPATIIPLPLLPLLLELVDKYALPESISQSLGTHLLAHAPMAPVRVYGLALLYNMSTVASEASQYLQPIATYSSEEIKEIPTVQAYHDVAQLQDFRVKALRSLLLTEDVFPHDYGLCSTHHKETRFLWDATRRDLVWKIETVTDVAGEMELVADAVKSCRLCSKATSAAVQMLAYKCRRVPRTLVYWEEVTRSQ